jgi:type II secretory pathway predicted ATPase ExeA/outer membrane protein OmpA-like peptidoglycan-associated protein
MYLAHYGLTEKPFSISPDPKFLWLGEKHAEALAGLEYGIQENKGFLLLTGEIGSGKTVLLNGLIKRISQDVIVANIQDPRLELIDFYNMLAYKLRLNKRFEKKVYFLIHFEEFLIKAYRRNKKVLLIIDEAQRLNSELMDEIRVLSNLELDNQKLINIFFVGQSELKRMLLEERNRPLKQRITYNYHLNPLIEQETAAYIKHRLEVAGADRQIFTDEAICEIHRFSQGIPRLINIICDHCLMTGYSTGSARIDENVVKECAEELQISLEIPNPLSTQTKVIEVDFPTGQQQANSLTRKSESSNKAENWKIAGIVITIAIIFGVSTLFFYMSRIEQSLNELKNKNDISITEDSEINSNKQSKQIEDSERSNEDTHTDKHIAEKDQGDEIVAEIKVSEKQPDNQNQEFVLDSATKKENKDLPVEDRQELLLENVNLENNSEGASKDKLIAEKVQDKKKNAELIIREGQPDNGKEEYDIIPKGEIKSLSVEDMQKLPLKNENSDEPTEDSPTSNLAAEKDQSNQLIAEINTSLEKKDNKRMESKTGPDSKSLAPEAYVWKREFSDLKNSDKNDKKQRIFEEVDRSTGQSNGRQSLKLLEHKFTIYFKHNSADLDNEAFENLKEIARIFSQNSVSEITIEGYADSIGDFNYNKTLSQFRSNIVESYLIAQGVAKSKIKATGLGSKNPVGNNRTQKGRNKNRRVEIKVKLKKNDNLEN